MESSWTHLSNYAILSSTLLVIAWKQLFAIFAHRYIKTVYSTWVQLHDHQFPDRKEVHTSSRPHHTSNKLLYTCIAPRGAGKVLGPNLHRCRLGVGVYSRSKNLICTSRLSRCCWSIKESITSVKRSRWSAHFLPTWVVIVLLFEQNCTNVQ